MMNEQELKARILELERAIVESRRCFRESDPLEARAWLIRVEVDEGKFKRNQFEADG